jgi:putative oxidoreductase
MATTLTEPVIRSETVRTTYPGERVVEFHRPAMPGAFGVLLGRLMICQIFIAAGVSKILDWVGTQGYTGREFRAFFDWAGITADVSNSIISAIPMLLAIAIAVELAGGLCLLLGYKTRLAAFALFAFLIPTTLIFHSFWRFPEAEQQVQTIMFMKNLAIMGGLAMLMSFGPGRVSVDNKQCCSRLDD